MNFSIKSSSTISSLFIFFSIILFYQSVTAQQPAFPTAYGAGAYTTGGRGGEVIHVTNLNDSGQGSLRNALQTMRSRYIVFDVSGTINLLSQIYIGGSKKSNFTVNGFSAPYGGITIIGAAIRSGEGCDNMIWRGIRFRNGYLSAESYGSLNTTCLAFRGASNVIVDHCSFAYAMSKGLEAGTSGKGEYAEKITFQNNLFGESQQAILTGNSDGKEYGNTSVLRNVISNVGWRHPKSGGEISLDVINNISHNWQGRTIRMDPYDFKLNHIGNYYQGGLITKYAQRKDKTMFTTWTNKKMKPQIWDEDNYITEENRALNYPVKPESAWYPFARSKDRIKTEWFVAKRLPLQGRAVPILSSINLKAELLPKVGACEYIADDGTVQFFRDKIDQTLVSNVLNRVQSTYISKIEYKKLALALINSNPSVKRSKNFYVSNPHIPEIWFKAHVPKGKDHNDIAPNGYTWLEEYLNQVDRAGMLIDVEEVEIKPSEARLEMSKTLRLSKVFTPSNASNQNGTWSSSNNKIATVDINGLVTSVSVGQVEITFKNADGAEQGKAKVTVFSEAIHASAGSDQQICEGESTTLTASGGASYLWSTGEKTETITVRPSATKMYSVTAFDSEGKNATTDNVTVNVNPVPVVDAGSNITIQSGDTTTLKVKGASQYKWNTGETGSSITVSPKSTTTYTVIGKTNDCEAKGMVTVTVINSSKVTASASADIWICEGSTTTLTATGGSAYLWSTGARTAKITVSPSTTSYYTVTVYDSTGKYSDTAKVAVKVNAVPIVKVSNNITINADENTTLWAKGADKYRWSTGSKTASIKVSPKLTTTYTVTGRTNGCEVTEMIKVTVINSSKVTARIPSDPLMQKKPITNLHSSEEGTSLSSTFSNGESIIGSLNKTSNLSETNILGDISKKVMVTSVNNVAEIKIKDEYRKLKFVIYPNPTFGDVNINISNVKSISSIHLYNSSGRLLYRDKINEGDQKVYEKTLSLSGYPSGLYLLKLVDNEKVITKKIILK